MIEPKLEQRLESYVKTLSKLAIKEIKTFPVFYSSVVKDKFNLPDKDTEFLPYDSKTFYIAPNSYYWFKFEIDVPATKKDEECFLSIFTNADKWLAIRPQGMLFVDGKLVCGIDVNHTDAIVTKGHHEVYFLFYSHEFETRLSVDFDLKIKDLKISSLYFDLFVPLESLKLLDVKSNEYIKSCAALEKAINLLDFRIPYSNEFYGSIYNCAKYLNKNYYNGICGSDHTVELVGHTHIDVAWLWDLDQTRQKAVRSFSTVLMLMDEYPEYKFMSSQPQLLQFVKENNPELFKKIKQKVKEKRWEVDGGLWLESEINLTSGESLVRQMYYGKKFYKDEFNVESKVLWLPDVFGYSGQLPQIITKCGIDKFVTAKIGWNDTNRLPYDIFNWEGIDGSNIFAYLLSTCYCDPRNGKYDERYTVYCDSITPRSILGTWNRCGQKEYTSNTLMSFGYGDGGGGPEREDLEKERRLRFGVPGLPKTHLTTLDESINKIKENFEKNASELRRTPKWNGELYFEFHRGTLSSVPEVKMNNRKAEFSMMNSEFASSLALLTSKLPYSQEALDASWKILLLNQFHDILPGTAISKVYDDSRLQFNELFKNNGDLIEKSLETVASKVNAKHVVFNFNGFTSSGVVKLENKAYIVSDIPAHGYKAIDNLALKSTSIKYGNKTLENKFYKILFNLDGSISSLFDKRNNREVTLKGEAINKFVAYEDIPHMYDNWEMEYYHKVQRYPLDDEASFIKINDGDRKGYKIVKKYCDSSIIQTVYLYEDIIDRIDFETEVKWNEKNQLLKVEFPVDVSNDYATYDIQFGNIKRTTKENTSWDNACFESVAHKWVDYSEKGFGVALLNDGKYGFNVKNNVMSMTVVKSARYPNENANDIIPVFTYSLLPHKGDFVEENVISESYMLNNPLIIRNGGNGKSTKEFSFVSSSNKNVVVETIKKSYSSNAYIIRLFECGGGSENTTLLFNKKLTHCVLTNLLEEAITSVPFKDKNVDLTLKPYEIITLEVKF